MEKRAIFNNSPAATLNLGKKVGRCLLPGSIVALIGELGCGKTVLTRGICEGLGVPPRHINSPTFVLVNEYRGRLPVFHLDMYQISDASEAVEFGMMDYLSRARSGVMIIEWAERVVSLLPDDILKVDFEILSDRKRKIVFSVTSANFTDVFMEIK